VRFPAAVRAFRWHLLLAAAILACGTAAAWRLVGGDMDRFYSFVPMQYSAGRGPSAPSDSLRAVLYSGTDASAGTLGLFSSFLFVPHAGIGMLCFALGFAAGLPVFGVVFTNGLILGSFGALYASRGLGWEFWSWATPHGVTEILAILLCAAA